MPELKLDWCSYKAAKYACEKWHYSKKIPTAKLTRIGVWENKQFIGCIIFGRGACNNLLTKYGLDITEGCELMRVALTTHISSVTRILSIAIKMLKKYSPKLRLIVSYADPQQKHLGIIYQAGNWIYEGMTERSEYYIYKNKKYHWRAIKKRGIKLTPIINLGKYKYLMPLDNEMRDKILQYKKQYPKNALVV